MILRRPTMLDLEFVWECFQDWPMSSKGPVTYDQVIGWMQVWTTMDTEPCWVAEEGGERVGLIKGHYINMPLPDIDYSDPEKYEGLSEVIREDPEGEPTAIVDNLIVHPDHRGNGYSDIIAALAWEKIPGVITKSVFTALPGAFTSHLDEGKIRLDGQYVKVGEKQSPLGTRLVDGERMRPAD